MEWECGIVNVLVGHRLLPWIMPGFFHLLLFCYVVIMYMCFVNVNSHAIPRFLYILSSHAIHMFYVYFECCLICNLNRKHVDFCYE